MTRRQRLALGKQRKPARRAALGTQEMAAQAVQHHAAGRLSEAIDCYRRLLALKPNFPEVNYNLGIALGSQGRLEEAAACYRKALVLKPTFPDAHNNLGNTLTALGKPQEAADCYRIALSLEPYSPEAHNGLGNALREQGRQDEATAYFLKALELKPDFPQAHCNLGLTLGANGRLDEATVHFRRSIDLRPDLPEAHINLGNALREQGRLEEAVKCYRRAIDLQSDQPEAHNNLGVALHVQGRLDEAIACYHRVIELKPDHLMAHNNLGRALDNDQRLDEAITFYQRAVKLRPDSPEALSNLVFLRRKACDWHNFQTDENCLADLIRRNEKGVAPFVATVSEIPLAGQLSCARLTRLDEKTKSTPQPFNYPPREGDRKIRIGYLSADFQRHATAYLIAELFERHDRSKFHISGYSIGPDDGSDMRQRLAAGFDRFIDIRNLSHAQAAARINDDQIDILVDLKGFTQHSRPQILAYRPAPIQVNYLGYPGTMGASFIDYILADAVVAPFTEQPFYSERVVHLPDCYQPNDSRRVIADPAPSRRDCGLPEHGFVFCCFNASYKITPRFFDIWMRLLGSIPDSVLWLIDATTSSQVNLRREAETRGIAPQRLVFAPQLPLAEHLARHCHADLFLDTLPCNAHTTGSDALWAGLPLLTCMGQTFAGRVASSLLQAIGLPELVTTSLKEYEELALKLASAPDQLAALKNKLLCNRLTAPLFDIARFTPHIEAAYIRMWETWCSGRSPTGFAVGDSAQSGRTLTQAASPLGPGLVADPPKHRAPPTPITVVCLRVPNFVHSGAYDDFANSVRFALQQQGNEVRLGFGIAEIGPRTLLFGAHLLRHVAGAAESVHSDTIIINTEHTSSQCFDESYLALLADHEVWDYSADNAAALTAKIGRLVRYVPFGYVPELSRIRPVLDEDIDVLFYGSINVRRQTILNRLMAAGLAVKAAFGVYGAERDELIARAKLVLNVHFYEPGHFEVIRVGYLLANRKAVVTEANPGEVTDADLLPGVAAVPYDALVQTVLGLVRDAPRRRALANAGFAAFSARDAGAIVGAALSGSWGEEAHVGTSPSLTRSGSCAGPQYFTSGPRERGLTPILAERRQHSAGRAVTKLAVVATMQRYPGGTGHARISNPLRALAAEPDVSVRIVSENDFPDIPPDTAGICILHRAPLTGQPGLDLIHQLLTKGYIIVSEFDANPDVFPVMRGTDAFAFRGVHAVQTSTEPLADIFRRQNPEVAVFPDGVLALPAVGNFADPNRRTLFFGPLNQAQGSEPLLPTLLPALNNVARSLSDRLNFRIVHDRALFEALDTTHKSFVPVCNYETYMQLLGQSEIAFLPLADTAFNRAKSDLEFVEASACRVAALASPVAYTSIADLHTGLHFSTLDDLVRRLVWLIVNPAAVTIADAARKWVADHRMLGSQTKSRVTWYRSLFARRSELTDALRARMPELAAISRTDFTTFPKDTGLNIVCSSQTVIDQITENVSCSASYVEDSNQQKSFGLDGVRLIAFYLPQYHPVPENDAAWGKGFTEWTNVTKAFPKFAGHYQPHLPIHLGFYDLRLADNLREQAALARKYGVHGFCFHHYWFSGKKLLEAPLATLLKNTDIDLPFCINWANENWTRGWDGGHSKILQSQNYAQNDAIEFARSVTDVMRDKRYIRVNGRPLLLVYRPELIPEIASVIRVWRTYFLSVGIGDPYIAMCRVIPNSTPEEFGIDAVVGFPPHPNGWHFPNINERFVMFDRNFLGEIKDYDALVADSLSVLNKSYKYFYGICPGFDNEPRRPGRGVTFHGSSPSKYGAWMEEVYQRTLLESSGDERLIFINAWNEWGEGAHLEPDRHYGYAFLAETARVLSARQYVPRP